MEFYFSFVIGLVLIFIFGFACASKEVDPESAEIPDSLNVPEFDLRKDAYYFSNDLTLQLIKACEKNDLVLAKKLIIQGANSNDVGPKDNVYNQFSVLHILIAKNDVKAAKILLQVGAKVDSTITIGSAATALHFAMNLDRVEMINEMLNFNPINTLDNKIVTSILFRSITLGRPRVIKLLLEKGVPIDLLDTAGYSIFMRSIGAIDFKLAEWILAQGASVNIEAVGGATAAFSIEQIVDRMEKGTPAHIDALRLMAKMKDKGATFPATPPNIIRERRKSKK